MQRGVQLMKTRVSRNSDLYDKIASDLESDAQSKDLSQFAQRLNQIDKQFNHTDVHHNETAPHRAKQTNLLEKNVITEKDNSEFDTFESTYLKEFLDEVKDYNVKKGYRDVNETSSNILNELNLDLDFSEKESSQSQVVYRNDNDMPFVPKDFDIVLKDIDPLLSDTFETEIVSEPNLDITRQFKAIDHESKYENSHLSLDETIALAIQKMDEEENEEEQIQEQYADQHLNQSEEVLEVQDIQELPNVELESHERFESYKMTQELMDHTQTLQHKIIDQERNIEEINDRMIKTNRMLNAVISLIIMAIVVVLMLIASTWLSNYWSWR